jgi:hypothetical protein
MCLDESGTAKMRLGDAFRSWIAGTGVDSTMSRARPAGLFAAIR